MINSQVWHFYVIYRKNSKFAKKFVSRNDDPQGLCFHLRYLNHYRDVGSRVYAYLNFMQTLTDFYCYCLSPTSSYFVLHLDFVGRGFSLLPL
jgi:hypothetical protein